MKTIVTSGVVSLALISIGAIVWQTAARTGLHGRYYLNTDWAGTPELEVVDDTVSTHAVSTRIAAFDDRPFSAVWNGFIYLDHPGRYAFAVTSDDGAWLVLDNQLVVDNGGVHGPTTVSATASLDAGLHPVEFRYFNAVGGFMVEVTTAYEGLDPIQLTTAVLFPSRLSYALQRAVRLDGYALPLLWSLCLLGVLIWYPALHLVRHTRVDLAGSPLGIALPGVLALSFVLNVVGIWWGLPHATTWAPDELVPSEIFLGLEQRFSGGWHSKYPPFHFYLLTALYSPFLAGAQFGLVDLSDDYSSLTLFLLGRGLTVTMAVGTVYVVYLCALELGHGRLAGLCSALLFATMPPFIFYGKLVNLDVPYLLWFSVSLLFYIRAIRTDQVASYVWFAITGMLAICTKDQAYGFYVLPAVHLVWHRYQAHRAAGSPDPARGLLLDRPLRLAAIAAALVFVVGYNLPFNLSGFVGHVQAMFEISGEDSQLWDRSVTGHLTMLWEGMRQLSWSLSWPGFIVCVVGTLQAGYRGSRRVLFVLLPAVSYYLFLISVVVYHYDRFWLGVCLILVLQGGPLLAELLTSGQRVWWKRLGVAGLFVYVTFHGVTVDLRLVNDARYYVEEWLRRPANTDAKVVMAGFDLYLPRSDGRRTWMVDAHWSEIVELEPDLVVINRGYSCRARPGSKEAEFYARLRDETRGYRLALAHRYQPPGPAVGPDRVWRADCPDGLTALATVNPEIQVFARTIE